jgi:Zn-dependent protease
MQVIDTLFFIIILLYSVILHEVAHGHMANILGDPTARMSDRLTLNPLKHLDPMGSVVVPLLLALSHGPIFGWAKPVPYNPYNLRNQRWGTLAVGIAGVLANFALALTAGIAIRLSGLSLTELLAYPIFRPIIIIAGVNIVLGVFNLIPIPPLDGSKVLFSLLPYNLQYIQRILEQYWFVFILLIFFVGGSFIVLPVANILFLLFTGFSLGLYGAVLPF